MLIKKQILGLTVSLIIGLMPSVFASILPSSLSYKQRQTKIASLLGWKKGTGTKFCDGYYIEPKAVKNITASNALKSKASITAKGPNFLQLHGASILRNHVVVKQPGRQIEADIARITRNKAGKISKIDLSGHVHLYENGKAIVTDHLSIELPTHRIRADTVLYRLHQTNKNNHGNTNAWGSADQFTQINPKLSQYKNATYSTCKPLNPSWSVSAGRLTLNKKTGLGSVHNAILKIKGIPVFPLPYWQFPIDHQRRTGLLAPSYSAQTVTSSGKTVTNNIFSLPIYLNLTPNWDDHLTLNWESKRGFVLGTTMRYLNQRFRSQLSLTWVPHDGLALAERDSGLAAISGNPSYPAAAAAAYETGLNALHSQRYSLNAQGVGVLNQNWAADWSLARASDDYFFRDYSGISGSDTNILRSHINLQYEGNHWRDHFFAESYQTLHRYDQLDYMVTSPYARQPEIVVSGFYANWLKSKMNLSLPIQLNHFADDTDFDPNLQRATRLHARPTLSLPIKIHNGALLPSIALDWRAYNIQNPNAGIKKHPGFAIPIFNLASHWIKSARSTLLGTDITQEITTSAGYLYVPTVNQSAAPNFDSYLPPFTYAQLFSLNRYSGYDRLDSANQLSLGLNDTFYDAISGTQLVSLNLGIQHDFTKSKVCLTTTTPCQQSLLSPTSVLTEMSYALTPRLNAQTHAAWNLNGKILNNLYTGINFNGGNERLLALGYSYTKLHDNPLNNTNWINNTPSNSLSASAAWPLSKRWRVMGHYDYDFNYKRFNLAFFGVEYNAYCWQFQLLFRQRWESASLDNDGSLKNTFNHRFMLTVQLKGLGDFGDTSASDEILKNIPNYRSFY